MRYRMLSLVVMLGVWASPALGQRPTSRQKITDFTGEVIAAGPVKVERPASVTPSPVHVTERIVNRMRITDLTVGPVAPSFLVPGQRRPVQPYRRPAPAVRPPAPFVPPPEALPATPTKPPSTPSSKPAERFEV